MITLILSACTRLECGPGTHEVEGQCVPDQPITNTVYLQADTDVDADVDADTDSDADADTTSTGDTAAPCPTVPPLELESATQLLVEDTQSASVIATWAGPGTMCGVSCDVNWVWAYIQTLAAPCDASVPFPAELGFEERLELCVQVFDAGQADEGHCRVEGSGGPWDFEVQWRG